MLLKDIDIIFDELKGSCLKERYMIGDLIDRGTSGQVYEAIDIEDDQRKPLVIKISQ